MQAGVLGEHPGVQAPQPGTGVDAELLREQRAGPVEGVEGVALPTGAIAGEHQQLPEALAQGVLGHQALEVGDRGGLLAEGEQGLEAALLRQEPELPEPPSLRGAEGRVLAAGVGRTPREGQAVLGGVERRLPALAVDRPAGQVGQLHEAAGVRVALGGREPVAGARGHQQAWLTVAVGLEGVPQPQDVGLERLGRGAWRVVGPERVDEVRGGHHAADGRDQVHQQDALLEAAHLEVHPTGDGTQGAEDLEVHGPTIGVRRHGGPRFPADIWGSSRP